MWTRLAAALYGAAALAAPALAQSAGEEVPRVGLGMALLWSVAAVLVIAALVTLFFGGRAGRGEPPHARRS